MRLPGALAAALSLVLVAAAPAGAADAPSLTAESAYLVETSTGDVVLARDADRPRAIASTTKLMTAAVVLDRVALTDVFTAIRYDAAPAESVLGLRAGERMTVRDLLRALLMASANDAAATLAVGVAGSRRRFVELMNAKARALGLERTRFANPVGLDDPDNHASAADLVRLAAVLRRDPFFRRTVDLPRATLRSGARRRVVVNRNRLVRSVPFVDGVKTGRTTRAGYVLVGSATRGGVTVLSAVLGEPSEQARDADTLALLRHGLSLYRRAALVRRGDPVARAALEHREQTVRLVAGRTVRRVVRRGERGRVRVLRAPDELDGPLPAGARVGTLEVRLRGRAVERIPLVTGAAVAEAGLGDRLDGSLGVVLGLAAVFVAVGGSLLVARRRRAQVRRRRREGRTSRVA